MSTLQRRTVLNSSSCHYFCRPRSHPRLISRARGLAKVEWENAHNDLASFIIFYDTFSWTPWRPRSLPVTSSQSQSSRTTIVADCATTSSLTNSSGSHRRNSLLLPSAAVEVCRVDVVYELFTDGLVLRRNNKILTILWWNCSTTGLQSLYVFSSEWVFSHNWISGLPAWLCWMYWCWEDFGTSKLVPPRLCSYRLTINHLPQPALRGYAFVLSRRRRTATPSLVTSVP